MTLLSIYQPNYVYPGKRHGRPIEKSRQQGTAVISDYEKLRRLHGEGTTQDRPPIPKQTKVTATTVSGNGQAIKITGKEGTVVVRVEAREVAEALIAATMDAVPQTTPIERLAMAWAAGVVRRGASSVLGRAKGIADRAKAIASRVAFAVSPDGARRRRWLRALEM